MTKCYSPENSNLVEYQYKNLKYHMITSCWHHRRSHCFHLQGRPVEVHSVYPRRLETSFLICSYKTQLWWQWKCVVVTWLLLCIHSIDHPDFCHDKDTDSVKIQYDNHSSPFTVPALACGKHKMLFSTYTRWFKYDRDKLWLVYTQIVPVIFEPPCTMPDMGKAWHGTECTLLGLQPSGI
jgi:hypothetical protein